MLGLTCSCSTSCYSGKDGFAVAFERAASHHIPLPDAHCSWPPRGRARRRRARDDYLPKPFDLNILLARIQSLLRRREWSRTLVTDPPIQPRVANPGRLTRCAEFDVYPFRKQIDFGTPETAG